MDKEHHNTVTTAASSIARNPFFDDADRAPYKLGNLLLKMPPEFNSIMPQTEESYQRAEAIAQHAENAFDAVLIGLRAIGTLMYKAANNAANPVSPSEISELGPFIEHICDELQFLRETQFECEDALKNRASLNTNRGRK